MKKLSKRLNKFDRRLINIPPEIISKIAQIDELKGRFVAGADLGPQILGRLKRSVLITSTGASTRIEGAGLGDEDVEKLMRGLEIKKFANRDKQEVRGYYELLENIFNAWKNIKFNENTIKHFHAELLKYAEKDIKHRGDYKKQENKVQMINSQGEPIGTIFETTPAYLTPKEIQELTDWTRVVLTEKKYHPLLIVANFLVEFLKIHPFQDGNGRLSRILTNFLLLQAGYLYMPYVSHEQLIEQEKSDYYIALRQSQKTLGTKKEDLSAWLDFFLNIFLKQSRLALELLSKSNTEKLLSEKQLLVFNYLKQTKEASTGEIAEETKIARPTVKQALGVLLRLRKIEQRGAGRSAKYVLK